MIPAGVILESLKSPNSHSHTWTREQDQPLRLRKQDNICALMEKKREKTFL